MSARDLAFIGIRLIAIYLALNVLYSIAGVAETLVAWYSGSFGPEAVKTGSLVYYGLISTGMYLLLSMALWIGANRIAQAVTPMTSRASGESGLGVRALQAIAFSAVGLLVLVDALPKIGAELYRAYLIGNAFGIPPEIPFAEKARRVQIAIELIFGVCLLLWGGALAGLLVRFRELGLPSETETSNSTPHPDAREAPRSASESDARAGGRER